MDFRLTIDVSDRFERLVRDMGRMLKVALEGGDYDTFEPEPDEPEEARDVVARMENLANTIKDRAAEEKAELQSIMTQAQEEMQAPSYPDDEEMKQHMDMTISRFAGNGWRDSKDTRVTAIRKGCTKVFKEIAAWLGAEKPTALEADKRLEFIKRLDEVMIEEGSEGKMPEIVFRPF